MTSKHWAVEDAFRPAMPSPGSEDQGASWAVDDAFGGLIPVQEGGAGVRRQPGPTVVPIPGNAPPRPSAPRPQASQPQAAPTQPQPMPPAVAPPEDEDAKYAEPEAKTWAGWAKQTVMGKRDPRYTKLPSAFELGIGVGNDAAYKLTGQNDAAYGDFLKAELGDKFIRRFKDANGYEIVGFRGEDGKEQLAYVNKPSWEWNDIDRGISQAIPYMAAATGVGRLTGSMPAIAQVLGQSAGAVATSGVQDAAASAMGSEQGVDLGKMAGAGIGAGAGQILSSGLGKLLAWNAERGLFDKATGRLTDKGMKAAESAGYDPSQWTDAMAKRFAQAFANSGDEAAAGLRAELDRFGVISEGQRTKDVQQLMKEQAMRAGLFGKGAKESIKEFDDTQLENMVGSTMGKMPNGDAGIAPRLAPHRSPGDYLDTSKSPIADIGRDIGDRLEMAREIARAREAKAWGKVPELKATDEALDSLWPHVNQSLQDFKLTDRYTPVASQMARDIEGFVAGTAPEAVTPGLKVSPISDVNEFRKILSKTYRSIPKTPETKADREAAGRVLDGYNSWVRSTAEQNLLAAEGVDAAVAAARMRTAVGISRRLHERFDGQAGSAGAQKMRAVLEKVDSPEQLVRTLFVGQTKDVPNGTIAAINSLKQVAAKYLPPEEAQALMGDLKLAYFLNLVRNPGGRADQGMLFTPTMQRKNLAESLNRQDSVWRTLFAPQDRTLVRQYLSWLERGPTFSEGMQIKPNSSGTGTMVGNLLMWVVKKLAGENLGKEAFAFAAGNSLVGRAIARQATDQAIRSPRPLLAPALGSDIGAAAGGAYGARSE